MNRYGIVVVACAVAAAACKHNEPATSSNSAPPVVTPAHAAAPAASAAPAGPFEGEIAMSVTDESAMKMPQSMTFKVKGDKVEYSSPHSAVRAVADTAAHRAYAISDARKTYVALEAGGASSAPAAPHAAVTKTPWSENVSGFACDVWLIDDGTEKVEACSAKGIPFFDFASAPKTGTSEPAWAAALTREKAFPLRVIATNEAGKEEYRAEATKIDRRTVAASTFEVPAGFTSGDVSADLRTASLP